MQKRAVIPEPRAEMKGAGSISLLSLCDSFLYIINVYFRNKDVLAQFAHFLRLIYVLSSAILFTLLLWNLAVLTMKKKSRAVIESEA